jgi:prepilin-type N-terminal cleavage/methylation domain-containing protein
MEKPIMTTRIQTRAFTLIEILVVVSIIGLLAAFLIVALNGSQKSAKTAKATVKLKEIGTWMQLWSGDNNNRILPSQFDYQKEADAGSTVFYRTDEHAEDDNEFDEFTRGRYQGTWADILWTDNNFHQTFGLYDKEEGEPHLLWVSDSPDNDIFEVYDSFDHPFRSTFENTRGNARGLPGFYAANDFFDSRSDDDIDGDTTSTVDRYYTYAMMNAPERSIYLVDSVAGETISDESDAWDISIATGTGPITQTDEGPIGDVDFRYGDDCMLLMLDGSIVRMRPWSERGPEASPSGTVDHSLYGRGYRVHQLTKRKATP